MGLVVGARIPSERAEVTRRGVAASLLLASVCAAGGFWAGRRLPGRAVLSDWVGARPPDLSSVAEPLLAAAKEFRLDESLLQGMVAAESGGNRKARSRAGAVGLLQLVPETAAEQAKALRLDPASIDLTDPATNLRLGARYFAWLLDLFAGDVPFAVAAYNAGPEPVKRWRLRAPDASPTDVLRREAYPETRRHVERVLKFREQYRAQR